MSDFDEPKNHGERPKILDTPKLGERADRPEPLPQGPRQQGMVHPGVAAVFAQRRGIGDAARRILRKQNSGAIDPKQRIPPGGGTPLAPDLKERFGARMGADLSEARIHTSGESADAAAGLGARAFTVGNDIHFNAGQYNPNTKEGARLLAHELTHVVQGQKSGIRRKAEERDAQAPNTADTAEVSQPGEPAEQEADAVADAVADSVDKEKNGKKDSPGGSEQANSGESNGDREKGDEKKSEEAKAGTANDTATEKPAAISAKLEGVGRKIFLAPVSGGPPSRPAPPSGGSTNPVDREVPLAEIKSEIVKAASKAGNPYTDAEVAGLAQKWSEAGPVKQSVLDQKKVGDVEKEVLDDWKLKQSPMIFCNNFAKHDPIAVRKFNELSGEGDDNYEGAAGAVHKARFYDDLAKKIIGDAGRNRKNVFFYCDSVVRGAGLRMKGQKIPPDKLTATLHRTAQLEGTWNWTTDKQMVGNAWWREQAQVFAAKNPGKALPPTIPKDTLQKYDKTIRHWWTSQAGSFAKQTLTGKLTPPSGGTWFGPGQVKVKDGGDTGFAQLMEIGALQPEWFAEGAIKFTISSAKLGTFNSGDNLRKPTCLDGMQSALFVPRASADTFGVTGGGFQEFLAAEVPVSEVVDMQFVVPSVDVTNEIQQLYQEFGNGGANKGRDANGRVLDNNTPMDGMERGAKVKTNRTTGMYQQVASRTQQEHDEPTPTSEASKNFDGEKRTDKAL